MTWDSFPDRGTRRYKLFTSWDLIRANAPGPISPEAHTALVEAIKAEGEVLQSDVRRQYQQEHEETRLTCEALAVRAADARQDRQHAQAALTNPNYEAGSLVKAVLYGAATVATAACEFLVSWATLPAALDIERASIQGVSISVAPVVAFIAMKEPLEEFLRAAPRWAVCGFHTLLAAGLLWVGYVMAQARSEITRVLAELLTGNLTAEFRQAPLDDFILALSLVLVVVGALFLLNAFRYGRPWLQHVHAAWCLRRSARAERRVLAQLAKCSARERALASALVERPVLLAAAWCREARAELAILPVTSPPADQSLERRLGLQPGVKRRALLA